MRSAYSGMSNSEPAKNVATKSRTIVDKITGEPMRKRRPSSAACTSMRAPTRGGARCRIATSAAITARNEAASAK